MKVIDFIKTIEAIAPLSLQESYDNAGLITGTSEQKVNAVMITIDVTEEVIDEAINQKANLIIAHHPIVFTGLKRFNGNNYIERCIIKAIKNDIAIYAAHTNIDSVLQNGVNSKIAEKIGLLNCKILSPIKQSLVKIVVFVPNAYADKVRSAIFDAGAGNIGNYRSCSYNIEGTGTFMANEKAHPFVGNVNQLHTEPEMRIETIIPEYLVNKVLNEIKNTHPYEEVAYDLYPLNNEWEQVGAGMIGELPEPENELTFLNRIKKTFDCKCIKYTKFRNKPVKRIAFCGGSGSSLLKQAIKANADVFLTSDIKYHQFFDADNRIIIADFGHFESEQFTKDLFYEILKRKFPSFAIYLTNVNTNPIKYL